MISIDWTFVFVFFFSLVLIQIPTIFFKLYFMLQLWNHHHRCFLKNIDVSAPLLTHRSLFCMRATTIMEGKFWLGYFHKFKSSCFWFRRLQISTNRLNRLPVNACESERCFSKAKEILSDRRTKLKPHVVDMLTFININENIHS